MEGKWTFCTSCGKPLSPDSVSDQASPPKNPEPPATPHTPPPATLTLPPSEQPPAADSQRSAKVTPQEWYLAADLYDDSTTATPAPIPRQEKALETMAAPPQAIAPTQAKDERIAPSLTMLSAYGEPETPSQFRWWPGAILGLFVLLFVAALGIGAWYWWSQRGSVAQTSPPINSSSGALTETPAPSPLTSPLATPSQSADEEIKRLRERRIAAKPSDSAEITSSLQQAEKEYPADYRFPYERAKLSIKGVISHHEAFEAIFLAAKRAIDNGESEEMLNDLMSDKDGDFYKMSRGHREWEALEEALRNKDKSRLERGH